MTRSAQRKEIIGWTEYVDIPMWQVTGLKAKVDTRAHTSSLHVDELQTLPVGRVHFFVVLSRKHVHKRVGVFAEVVKWAKVRSSTGVYRKRCFVKTRIRIGHIEKEIELSLVSREKMMFRMLLGRKALERDFLVDVTKRSLLSVPPGKRQKDHDEDRHTQP